MPGRNRGKEQKLVNDWSYFKPLGPHFDDDEAERIRNNLMELDAADLKRLVEAGDAMQEYINNL